MKSVLLHPLFMCGLLIRFALIALPTPQAELTYYLPFLQSAVTSFSFDPWQVFLDNDGSPLAFPYGYVMWFVFLPAVTICRVLGIDLHFGYSLTLVAADICMLLLLLSLWPRREKLVLITYWLSPIVLFASYILGLNDLIPITLLTAGVYFLQQRRPVWAGILCVMAISAKLSMMLSIPFFLLYLVRQPSPRRPLQNYILGLLAASICTLLPFAFSLAGLRMLMDNPEMHKVYQAALEIGADEAIYILLVLYCLMLYGAWRIYRLNILSFQVMTGLAFLLVVMLTSASPGWFIWLSPFLVLYQALGGVLAYSVVGVFSVIYLLDNLFRIPGWESFTGRLHDVLALTSRFEETPLHTLLIAAGLILAIHSLRETKRRSHYFRLNYKPFVIGIAGDSSVGKDTLANALKDVLGTHTISAVNGDNYHLWDRHERIWKVMTHLNPNANDLKKFSSDVRTLIKGQSVVTPYYDHYSGTMGHPRKLKPNDFIVVSGLHALYLPVLREAYDLAIYLTVDEALRRQLKIRRDVHTRGYSLEKALDSLERRRIDAEEYIHPQAAHADFVATLSPIKDYPMTQEITSEKIPGLKLHIRSRLGFFEPSLIRALVGIGGLYVDVDLQNGGEEASVTIEGECSVEDIKLMADVLYPHMQEFLEAEPQWHAGTVGLMQLITLSYINHKFQKRVL